MKRLNFVVQPRGGAVLQGMVYADYNASGTSVLFRLLPNDLGIMSTTAEQQAKELLFIVGFTVTVQCTLVYVIYSVQ